MSLETLPEVVDRCQKVMSHAWMVRAFLRRCDEVEDFPELVEMGRAIFDFSRALETRADDPPGYLKMLQKKLTKFRKAVAKFKEDAQELTSHTNFEQAIISLETVVDDLIETGKVGFALLKSESE